MRYSLDATAGAVERRMSMPSKIVRVLYECKYCGKEFEFWDECNEHEQSHIRDYKQADTQEIIEELKQLGERAYSYHVGYLTVGIPPSNFESLMVEAAKRLEEGRTDGET